jgi:NADPH:quinone reductase-like Zn-dependent oxidoreductase
VTAATVPARVRADWTLVAAQRAVWYRSPRRGVTAKGQDPVKAIVQDRFGPPDVLRLSDTGLPEAGPDDVLVRVHAAALNPADWHILRGDPLVARLMGVGLTRPKARVAGIDAAGVVEAAGANVRGLANGGDVLGFFRGAFAEYACAAADLVVPKPAGLTFEQAAAVPIAATTALRGIRDVGEVTAGQRVLINGAGGGVGSYAVQIAAALGAEVTGVCSTRNVELVRSIGAAHVIDYTTDDFTGGRARYDVILDNVSSLPLARLRRALTAKGTLVLNGGGSPGHVFGPVAGIVRAAVANAFVSQRLRPLPSRQNREELLAVTGLIEDGKLTPVVDRTYPLADTAEGLRYVEQGHARGKAVVTVA